MGDEPERPARSIKWAPHDDPRDVAKGAMREIACRVCRHGGLMPEAEMERVFGTSTCNCFSRRPVCDGCGIKCGSQFYDLPYVSLCWDCGKVVFEAHHYRHSGDFHGWRARWREGGSSSRTRLSDPVTTGEAMKVYRRDDFTCRYCGGSGGDLTVDHIDPEGGNEMSNYATACRSCNSSKGRRTPDEADMQLLGA